jgi:hypothetical protein
MRRTILALLAIAGLLTFGPTAAVADSNNESATFELLLEEPNISQASNGDTVEVTGMGVFSVHPKSAEASGGFTHKNSQGTVVGSGTWTATDLLSFEFYGCRFIPAIGADLGSDDLCGGALKLRVILRPSGTTLALPGVLTVFCIVGLQSPSSHDDETEEGVSLVVPGLANFNEIVSGLNIYIREG